MKPPASCFNCPKGRYVEIGSDYIAELPNGDLCTIADLTLLVCNICGEQLVPPESSKRIDKEIEQYNNNKGEKK